MVLSGNVPWIIKRRFWLPVHLDACHTRYRFSQIRLDPCSIIIGTTVLPSYPVTRWRIVSCTIRTICCWTRTWTSRAHTDCTWLGGRTRGIRRTSCPSRGFCWSVGIRCSLGSRITSSPEINDNFRILFSSEPHMQWSQWTLLFSPLNYISFYLDHTRSYGNGMSKRLDKQSLQDTQASLQLSQEKKITNLKMYH